MNKLSKIATAVALSIGVTTIALAHPGEGRGMGPGAQQGQHQGMQGSMGHGRMQGMDHGQMQGMQHKGPHAGHGNAQGQGPLGSQTGQSLITPEEHAAFRDKMRNAKTPEERQQIALANRAEMEKRAAEKGITLPEHREHRGEGRGTGPRAGHQH